MVCKLSGVCHSPNLAGLCCWDLGIWFCGSRISVDEDRSHEIKRHLFLGRKSMRNLDHVLEIRDITLPTKVHLVKAIVFPVVMYGCESWTITKAEELMLSNCGAAKIFESPWTARRSNQSILKEINPEYALERVMLRLKLQSFGLLMQRANSLKKTGCWERLRAGGVKGNRG